MCKIANDLCSCFLTCQCHDDSYSIQSELAAAKDSESAPILCFMAVTPMIAFAQSRLYKISCVLLLGYIDIVLVVSLLTVISSKTAVSTVNCIVMAV
jgi:hypothetical protein